MCSLMMMFSRAARLWMCSAVVHVNGDVVVVAPSLGAFLPSNTSGFMAGASAKCLGLAWRTGSDLRENQVAVHMTLMPPRSIGHRMRDRTGVNKATILRTELWFFQGIGIAFRCSPTYAVLILGSQQHFQSDDVLTLAPAASKCFSDRAL